MFQFVRIGADATKDVLHVTCAAHALIQLYPCSLRFRSFGCEQKTVCAWIAIAFYLFRIKINDKSDTVQTHD